MRTIDIDLPDFCIGDQSTTWSAMRTCTPTAVTLPISASIERSASENLVRRFGGEVPAASSSHDGVKGAVFPEFGARAPCGFQKSTTTPPMGGVMAPPSQPVAEGLYRS